MIKVWLGNKPSAKRRGLPVKSLEFLGRLKMEETLENPNRWVPMVQGSVSY